MAKTFPLSIGGQVEVSIDDYDHVSIRDEPARLGAKTAPDALGRVLSVIKCHALHGRRWLVCADFLPEYADTMPLEV